MINFRIYGLNQQKSQKENFWKSQQNAWKRENKCKRKGKMDLLAWREENFAKRSKENNKNLMNSLCRVGKRKKSLKKFWKRWVEQVKIRFLKTLFTIFDWPKINFDWLKQIEALLKFFKTISIDRKTNSINWNR